MKTILLAATALLTSAFTFAQHNEIDSQTKSSSDKAMLDGQAFVVMLTDNSSASTGKIGNMDSDRYMDNPNVTQPNKNNQGMNPTSKAPGTNEKKEAGSAKKMVLRFENGMVRTSGKGDLKVSNCSYKSWGMESTGISFTADCNNTTGSSSEVIGKENQGGQPQPPAGSAIGTTTKTYEPNQGSVQAENNSVTTVSASNSTQLSGTVNGDTIHGTITCNKSDGSVKTYSYTGTKAGKNDLDMENEMGMK